MESYGFKIDHGMEESSLDSVHATDASLSLLDPVEAPDSEEMTPRVVVLDSMKVVPNSVEMVPDSVETLCARYGTFHVGDTFGEACFPSSPSRS
ncbi:hypothetical protein SORBI_3001G121300 [Sorghum bicolor]|uniref:Uncharacterized protein n=1 Tax=Sorghum bicolor TaxID=4558 RepID=A0A1Z5S5C6_SORBI|nr:hypothetical protein SORBI_3001G121300 [Sorghum bicolor]